MVAALVVERAQRADEVTASSPSRDSDSGRRPMDRAESNRRFIAYPLIDRAIEGLRGDVTVYEIRGVVGRMLDDLFNGWTDEQWDEAVESRLVVAGYRHYDNSVARWHR